MLESTMEQQKYEAPAITGAHTEDWFAARDWVAVGERFRPRQELTSNLLTHILPAVKSTTVAATTGRLCCTALDYRYAQDEHN
jgi:hypothetical protein